MGINGCDSLLLERGRQSGNCPFSVRAREHLCLTADGCTTYPGPPDETRSNVRVNVRTLGSVQGIVSVNFSWCQLPVHYKPPAYNGILLYQPTLPIVNGACRNKGHVSPSRTGLSSLPRDSQPPWMGSPFPTTILFYRKRLLRCQCAYLRLPADEGCRGGRQ